MKPPPALVPVIWGFAGRDLHQRRARCRLQVGQARQLARRAVYGVLDALTDGYLLHAAGRELEQLREHELRLLAANAHGEADHAA